MSLRCLRGLVPSPCSGFLTSIPSMSWKRCFFLAFGFFSLVPGSLLLRRLPQQFCHPSAHLVAHPVGSSATLVKDELIRNILFFAIRSWSHTDLFPILLLQTLPPKSMDSQAQVQSTLVSERLERGSSMRTSGQGSLPLAMSHRSMPFPVHFFSACDLVPLLLKRLV